MKKRLKKLKPLRAKDLKKAVKEEGKQWMQFASFLLDTALNTAKPKKEGKERS